MFQVEHPPQPQPQPQHQQEQEQEQEDDVVMATAVSQPSTPPPRKWVKQW
jgi:hypothetical protein